MLDTSIWNNSFKGEDAEYAIGGPTADLLFTAYNKYKNKSGGKTYELTLEDNGQVGVIGYWISKDGGAHYDNYYDSMIENDSDTVDSPYSVSNLGSIAEAYWVASPICQNEPGGVMYVQKSGRISNSQYSSYYGTQSAFRPLVCLNKNCKLEKVTVDGKEVFNIVH